MAYLVIHRAAADSAVPMILTVSHIVQEASDAAKISLKSVLGLNTAAEGAARRDQGYL